MQFKGIYESGDNRLDLIGKYTRITNNLYAMNKWMDKYDEIYKKSVGNDFPVLRYPDILLMYAEALGEQDRIAEALPYLNRTRTLYNIFFIKVYVSKTPDFARGYYCRLQSQSDL